MYREEGNYIVIRCDKCLDWQRVENTDEGKHKLVNYGWVMQTGKKYDHLCKLCKRKQSKYAW